MANSSKSDSSVKPQYVFSDGMSERDRLVLQHKIFQPCFQNALNRVFGHESEGLLKDWFHQGAITAPLFMLDMGCGEGLYLHDLADTLLGRGLSLADKSSSSSDEDGVAPSRSDAQLIGLDIDSAAVATAAAFGMEAVPSKSYLNFLVHDATQALETCQMFQYLGVPKVEAPANIPFGFRYQFDFIYAFLVLEHLPQAREHLARWYEALRPGGVIFLFDATLGEGPEGWYSTQPAILTFFRLFCGYIKRVNPEYGTEPTSLGMTTHTAEWLRELGAEQVETFREIVPFGGPTVQGQQMLRNTWMTIQNSLPRLLATGRLSEAQGQEINETLRRELSPDLAGHTTWIGTLARKPL